MYQTRAGRVTKRVDYATMSGSGRDWPDEAAEGAGVSVESRDITTDVFPAGSDLAAMLRAEEARQEQLLNDEKEAALKMKILKLREENAARERSIKSANSSFHARADVSGRDVRREPGLAGRGRSETSRLHQEVEELLASQFKRTSSSSSSADESRTDGECASGSDDVFSLECRSKKGKRKAKSRLQKQKQSQQSGINERRSERVTNRQMFPHVALQQEYLWGLSGEDLGYQDLTLGLFVAGELEIILGGMMAVKDAQKRLALLKITAYRSQYMSWGKLLHLHAAILHKIETGQATWSSPFDHVEKMVLENPGKMNWGSRVGPKNQEKRGVKASGKSDEKKTWWCRDYQSNNCQVTAPHTKNVQGREVTVKHICARCFQKDGSEKNHPEKSTTCPHFQENNQ